MTMVNKPFGDIVTFTRSSTGTYFDAIGVLQVASANQPRFDHDPVTGQPLGILIEPQRTNLYVDSQIIGGSTGTTAIINSVVAPDGTTTADQLIEDSTNGEHYSVDRAISITAGGIYTFSVFVKPLASGSARRLFLRVAAGGNTFGTYFDLISKTHQAGGGSVEAGYQELPYGWLRVWMKFTANASAVSIFRLQLAGYSMPPHSYVGDGVSGLTLWGVQLEAGSFPTSYIPTEASQVTRASDVCSVNTLSPWYNPEQGTLVVEGEVTSRTPTRISADIGAGGAFGTTLYLAHTVSVTVAAPAVAPVNTSASVPDTALTFKSALAMRKNGMTVASNGVLGSTDVLCEMPMVPNKLTIGKGGWNGGDSSLNGHIKSLRYFPRHLTDSELQAITS